MDKAIAVIDIGMTNKKVAVYDTGLRMLDSVSRTFDPVILEGLETHDLAGMEEWFLGRLSEFGKKYPIGAIAVTTHGATTVCVGEDGEPCAPCVYYTHEPGEEFQERFYALAGDPRELQAATGTPPLSAMVNTAKGILFLKERFPEAFARTKVLLNYPQYWGFRLTGKSGAEGTYTGCHTYFWDWQAGTYSSVAEVLGVARLMPFPLRDSWAVLGRIKGELAKRLGLSPEVLVTMGIHDSNASLLPHLAKKKGVDFIVNSTGTWCVIMHPQESFGFSPDELGKVVFFNRSAYNKPVKTAIFLGGMEYEAWTKAIAAACGCDPSPSALADPGPEVYRSVLSAASEFILPEFAPGTGQFPGSLPRAIQEGRDYALAGILSDQDVPPFMRDAGRSLAVLNISLALQTMVALERAGLARAASGRGTEVFTEGGFRKNSGYNAILAAALAAPSASAGGAGGAYLTDISEATAFGAAMTAAAALEGIQPDALGDRFEIEYKAVSPMQGLADLDKYRAAWLAQVGNKGGRA